MKKFLQEKGIRWRFNLARAPWWGGLFERLVGSMKRMLRKVFENNCFDYDELETIIVEVEGTLSNRPLTYDYDEVQAEMLTPSHLSMVIESQHDLTRELLKKNLWMTNGISHP